MSRREMRSGDAPAAREIAHKLKAGARSVGANQLGETCEELEQAAESGRVEQFGDLWERLEDQLIVVRAYLDGQVTNR